MNGSTMSLDDFAATVIKVLYFCLCFAMLSTVAWLVVKAVIEALVQWT